MLSVVTRFLLVTFFWLALSAGGNVSFASPAEQQDISWSEPENLTRTPTSSLQQAITSDRFGGVHFFWVEDYEGVPVEELFGAVPTGNTINYRYWNGNTWSASVDLFFTDNGLLSYPVAVVDDSDTLYLFWNSPNGLRFSSVGLQDAGSARSWLPERTIASVGGYQPAVITSGPGALEVVYSAFTQDGAKDGNLYYTSTSDGGETWSPSTPISSVSSMSQTLAVFPRLARDASGTMHLVWYETDPPDYLGTSVHYSRSEDNGITWEAPRLVWQSTQQYRWASAPQVATVAGKDEVLVTWVCGTLAHRCYQFSSDGGNTWSEPTRVFGNLHSLAVWDAIISAPNGDIYWLMQLREPNGLYYSRWDGDEWADPPYPIDLRVIPQGHAPQATLVAGNDLHLVVNDQSSWDIWWTHGESALLEPLAPARFTETSDSTPMMSPTPAEVIREPTIRPTAAAPVYELGVPPGRPLDNAPGLPLTVAVISVAFLLLLILLLRVMRQRT